MPRACLSKEPCCRGRENPRIYFLTELLMASRDSLLSESLLPRVGQSGDAVDVHEWASYCHNALGNSRQQRQYRCACDGSRARRWRQPVCRPRRTGRLFSSLITDPVVTSHTQHPPGQGGGHHGTLEPTQRQVNAKQEARYGVSLTTQSQMLMPSSPPPPISLNNS